MGVPLPLEKIKFLVLGVSGNTITKLRCVCCVGVMLLDEECICMCTWWRL